MPTVSANPVRLLELAATTRRAQLPLRRQTDGLEELLARAARSCPGLVASPVVPHLRELSACAERLAGTVEASARAFLAADDGKGIDDLARWLVELGSRAREEGELVQAVLRMLAPLQAALGRGTPPPILARFLPRAGLVGAALLLVRTIGDTRAVARQGNPFRAFERRGSNYVADLERVRLDVLLAAFTAHPSPETGTAALVSFALWCQWRSWDERRRFAGRVVGGLDRLQDEVRDDAEAAAHVMTERLRQVFRTPIGSGPAAPVPFLPAPAPLERWVDRVLDQVDLAVSRMDDAGDDLAATARVGVGAAATASGMAVDGSLHWAADRWDDGAEAVEDVGAAVGAGLERAEDAAEEGLRRLFGR